MSPPLPKIPLTCCEKVAITGVSVVDSIAAHCLQYLQVGLFIQTRWPSGSSLPDFLFSGCCDYTKTVETLCCLTEHILVNETVKAIIWMTSGYNIICTGREMGFRYGPSSHFSCRILISKAVRFGVLPSYVNVTGLFLGVAFNQMKAIGGKKCHTVRLEYLNAKLYANTGGTLPWCSP